MHAKLRRGNTSRRGTRPGVETTHQTTRQHTRRHRCGGRRRDWRARLRCPWAAAGPGRATNGRPTLQTSSNQRNSNHLTRTPVTNVVNPSPKTAIISEKALRLTTFVTTGQKSTRKTPWIDDVCNNTHPSNISDQAPLVWRAPEGLEGQAAVPVGGNDTTAR